MFEAWTSQNSEIVKVFFGKPARLLTAAWIIERGGASFFQQEAVDGVRAASEAASAIQTALEQFVFFGMLSSVPDGRKKYYTQLAHPLWRAYEGIAAACDLLPRSTAQPVGTKNLIQAL
jgi:hypothetical protein